MTTVVLSQMSEVIDPGLELLERQNRFVNEHLRRIFVQIYRIVRNRADAQDLTQGVKIWGQPELRYLFRWPLLLRSLFQNSANRSARSLAWRRSLRNATQFRLSLFCTQWLRMARWCRRRLAS